jgi:hypothetical protein
MNDIRFCDLQEKASALKTLHGDKPVYLTGDPPWHLALSCEAGSSHRLDISTSVTFTGFDPDTGLNLRWSFDIEPHSANGSNKYHIDTNACRDVMRALPVFARGEFRNYLRTCAEKVRARGEEFQKAADKQRTDASILSDLAATP